MNYKAVFKTLGKVMLVISAFMFVPLIVGLIYKENNYLSFLIPICALIGIGLPLSFIPNKNKAIFAKEGFVIVALSWIIMSLIGALPYVISGAIPNFENALFESVSGFTTTGASVVSLSATEIALPRAIMFWRLFTHWIGGMGVLVFVLAILPSDGNSVHIFRAEAPGPSASKLVSKVRTTALILYGIYIAMTVLEAVMLMFSGMGVYESVLNAFSTAGTGGFGIYADSIAHYNSLYVEMVIAVFMLLFGINFNLFYLILIGKSIKALKSEELLTYLIIILVAVFAIAGSITASVGNFATALRYSFFQTTSMLSSTGFASTDFASSLWPPLAKGILTVLCIIGACGGSTGGGIKVSRLVITSKSIAKNIKKSLHPRSVNAIKFEGEIVSGETERRVLYFLVAWLGIVISATLLLSIDGFDAGGQGLFTHFSSTLACIGNTGPGITTAVGPFGSYAGYNAFSKVVLCFVMLAGRLEIFPIILLFAPRTWRKS